MLTRYNLVFSGGQVIAKWENMVAKSDEVAVGWDRRILARQMWDFTVFANHSTLGANFYF